jgi:hypothetical protein
MNEPTQQWSHRRLLANYLWTLAICFVSFAIVAAAIAWFTNWEFAAFLAGFGSLAMFAGIPHGYQRFCAQVEIVPHSVPGPELRWLPWASGAVPAAFVYLAVHQCPNTTVSSISLAVAGLGFVWAMHVGCSAIAGARPAV